MRAIVDDDLSHLYKILPLSIVQTYLHRGVTLPHRSTPSCNILQLFETSEDLQKRP